MVPTPQTSAIFGTNNLESTMERSVKRYACVVFLWSNLAIPASADALWTHNGSTVRLLSDGSNLVVEYVQPRSQLRAAGVEAGTVLFRGKVAGEKAYSGTAFRFSRRCGPIGYFVKGTLVKDKNLILRGRLPKRNQNCTVVGYSDDVLVFSLGNHPAPDVASAAGLMQAPEHKKQLTERIQQPRSQRSAEADIPAARVPFNIVGCRSLETFVHWVQEFQEADAEVQPSILIQGMQTEGCTAIAEGFVSIMKTQELYSCVRPQGEALCYWTLKAVFNSAAKSRG